MMPWPNRNEIPYQGLKAMSTLGSVAIQCTPGTAMIRNHTVMIGPKKLATLAVPRDCTANRTTRIATVRGTM